MNNNRIFGIRPVLEAIEAGREIEKVYLKKDADGQLISELRDICLGRRIRVQEVPIQKLNRLERRGNHQGVVAVMSTIEYAELDDIVDAVREGACDLVVLFDSITDVRNFGGIARSAECAGASALIVSLKNAAPVNADAIKSSAGALNLIPVCRVGSIRNTLKILKAEGMQVVAATEKGNLSLFESNMSQPTVLVMGSEDKGVSNEVLKLCDQRVVIPMRGNIDSLNVSAAAAVMLFEVVRQRGTVEE